MYIFIFMVIVTLFDVREVISIVDANSKKKEGEVLIFSNSSKFLFIFCNPGFGVVRKFDIYLVLDEII